MESIMESIAIANNQSSGLMVQKLVCLTNLQAQLSTAKAAGRLGTGRNITAAHLGAAYALVDLLFAQLHQGGGLVLESNRENIAQRLFCCPRSVYNYLLDFASIDLLTWFAEWIEPINEFKIYIEFNNKIFTPISKGEAKSDTGKICHNQDKNRKTDNTNNSLPAVDSGNMRNIEEKQIKEKQGQQTLSKAECVENEYIELSTTTFDSPKFRATPEDERKEVEYFANRIFAQMRANLWEGQEVRREVREQSVKLIALTLMHHVAPAKSARADKIREFCQGPAYQAADGRSRQRMMTKFLSKLPINLAMPYRGAFSLLSRAAEIQSENCKKKGYSCYYPTYYLANQFDTAIGYALAERRAMIRKSETDLLRLHHCEAKFMVESSMALAVDTRRKFGLQYTLDLLRKEYSKLSKFLQQSVIEDKKKYLERFLSQMACIK